MMASATGFTAAVRMLLARGVAPDAAPPDVKNFATPLIAAASKGHRDVVKVLLEGGADQNFVDQQGRTAWDHAAGAGHQDIVQLLEETSRG